MPSTCSGNDAACHENLVHPAMLSHKKGQASGGEDSATLREVSKHNAVGKVVVIITVGYLPYNSGDDADYIPKSAANLCYWDDSLLVDKLLFQVEQPTQVRKEASHELGLRNGFDILL